MIKFELSHHICKKFVLYHQHKLLVNVLKSLNLVMHLNKNGFCVSVPGTRVDSLTLMA